MFVTDCVSVHDAVVILDDLVILYAVVVCNHIVVPYMLLLYIFLIFILIYPKMYMFNLLLLCVYYLVQQKNKAQKISINYYKYQ
jgi:hypothetical protein